MRVAVVFSVASGVGLSVSLGVAESETTIGHVAAAAPVSTSVTAATSAFATAIAAFSQRDIVSDGYADAVSDDSAAQKTGNDGGRSYRADCIGSRSATERISNCSSCFLCHLPSPSWRSRVVGSLGHS